MFITVIYLYLSGKKSVHNNNIIYEEPSLDQLIRILINILITEILAIYAFWYSNLFSEFSSINLTMFFLTQDIYFYSIHRLLHAYAYRVHAVHHEIFGPLFAWNTTLLDHILLNVMSVAVPFYFFPNTKMVLLLIITLEIYTSVNGHTYNSPHHTHHKNLRKRFGSIYLVDRLLGSY